VPADASPGAPGLNVVTGGGGTVAAGARHSAGEGWASRACGLSAAGGADSPPVSDGQLAGGGACEPLPSRRVAPEGVDLPPYYGNTPGPTIRIL